MRAKRHLAAVSLASCAVLLLLGCGVDRRPIVLGTGEITAGSGPSDHSTPNDNAAEPTPEDSAPNDNAGPLPEDSAPNDNAAGRLPEDSIDSPVTCGPGPGTQQSTSGAHAVPTPFTDDEAELDADGQVGDGGTVILEEVQLARTDGFVAVCSLDDNRLLGSSPITRSTAERSVRVTLDEPLTITSQLLVVLYADNGDGHFDWATDPRVSGDEDDITDLEVERLTYRYAH
jgi:hypothetical protein